mmetsp:Transcript_100516/g.199655  ORF Transcript_100516/g.199655 Transcript_100516/m.199655 type:complete len:87 (-) Transcript_100516:25-285(-)
MWLVLRRSWHPETMSDGTSAKGFVAFVVAGDCCKDGMLIEIVDSRICHGNVNGNCCGIDGDRRAFSPVVPWAIFPKNGGSRCMQHQ